MLPKATNMKGDKRGNPILKETHWWLEICRETHMSRGDFISTSKYKSLEVELRISAEVFVNRVAGMTSDPFICSHSKGGAFH